MAAKAAVGLGLTEITKEPRACPEDEDKELPRATKVVVP